MNELWIHFSEACQSVGTTPLEVLGFVFGITCIGLNALENIWGWPTGLINVAIYIYIFYDARLYADVGLNIFFFITGVYGWYNWLKGGEKKDDLPITISNFRQWGMYILMGGLGILGIGYFFDNFTNADLAYWDAYITSFSLVAQVLMARKKIENWLIWIAVDIIAIGVYWYKDLRLTAVMFFIYLILATLGYFNWKRKLTLQTAGS
ncbi:MAG: nicotinamide riboside transporter PnuC [Bacteroidia bacterium]|nr:nicotinamide riboside transporter PnuC [Bacteroidia bacterium]